MVVTYYVHMYKFGVIPLYMYGGMRLVSNLDPPTLQPQTYALQLSKSNEVLLLFFSVVFSYRTWSLGIILSHLFVMYAVHVKHV